MINRVVLVGRITKDPELKLLQGDLPIVRFTLAVNRRIIGNDGIKADFILCVAWRKQAENLNKYISKGALIGVEGSIRVKSFDDDITGQKKFWTEINCDSVQFLESKKDIQNSKYTNSMNFDDNYRNNIQDENDKDAKSFNINIEKEDDLIF